MPDYADSRNRPAFHDAVRRIIGALLDAVVAALAGIHAVKIERLPRMADFAIWSTAAETAMGFKPGEFMAAYTLNREGANELALDSVPFVKHLRKFMSTRDDWTGRAGDLLAELNDAASDDEKRLKDWPKAANALSGKLKRVAPNLRAVGIDIEAGGRTNAGRVIRIRKTPEKIDITVTPTLATQQQGISRDDPPWDRDDLAQGVAVASTPQYYGSVEKSSSRDDRDDRDDLFDGTADGDAEDTGDDWVEL